MEKNKTHTRFMKRAINLALKGKGKTSPNPIVGSVLVKGGRVIAEGYHKRAGGPHAEVIALRKAGQRAKGATLYVTMEPCNHYGRTPPCIDQVLESGVTRVVVGMKDPNPLTNGKSFRKLKKARIKTTVNVLKKECEAINTPFIKYCKSTLPYVVAKCAQTLDGKIATFTGQSKWITSKKTRDFARKQRDQFDAILVGVNTILKDNPRLNGVNKTKRIKKVVVDSTLKTPLTAKLFKGVRKKDCIIATTQNASRAKVKKFEKKGITVTVCPGSRQGVQLKALFKQLAKDDIRTVLIEGGGAIIGSALKAKLIDEMHIYVAPKIIGDKRALSSVAGFNVSNVSQSVKLKDITIQSIGEDLFLKGHVYGNH